MMRTALLSALVLSTIPIIGHAQAVDVPVSPEEGKIILYRTGGLNGAALGCPIRYQGSEVVELGRSKAFEWKVKPGRYILENKTSSVEVNVAAGEIRFVRCQIKTGFLTGRADLQIVDGNEYAKKKDQFEAPGS